MDIGNVLSLSLSRALRKTPVAACSSSLRACSASSRSSRSRIISTLRSIIARTWARSRRGREREAGVAVGVSGREESAGDAHLGDLLGAAPARVRRGVGHLLLQLERARGLLVHARAQLDEQPADGVERVEHLAAARR